MGLCEFFPDFRPFWGGMATKAPPLDPLVLATGRDRPAEGLGALAAVGRPLERPRGFRAGGWRASVSDRRAAAAGRGPDRGLQGAPKVLLKCGGLTGHLWESAERRRSSAVRMHRLDARNFVIGFQTFVGMGAPGRRRVPWSPQGPPWLRLCVQPLILVSERGVTKRGSWGS